MPRKLTHKHNYKKQRKTRKHRLHSPKEDVAIIKAARSVAGNEIILENSKTSTIRPHYKKHATFYQYS